MPPGRSASPSWQLEPAAADAVRAYAAKTQENADRLAAQRPAVA
ncbi:hypothetical protein [Streptomyces sp. NPDC002889]